MEFLGKLLGRNKSKVVSEEKLVKLNVNEFPKDLKKNDIDEDIRTSDKAIESDPSRAVSLYNEGIALDKAGKHEDAIKCIINAIKIDPHVILPWISNGSILLTQDKYNEIIQTYLDAHPQDKLNSEFRDGCLEDIVKYYESQGNYDGIVKAYKRAIEIGSCGSRSRWLKLGLKWGCDHSNAVAEYMEGIANALKKARKYDEALEAYENAIKYCIEHLDSQITEDIRLNRMIESILDNGFDEPFKSRGIEICNKLSDANLQPWIKGIILYSSGRPKESLDCFRIYDTEDFLPLGNFTSWYNLGRAHNALGEYEQALQCYNAAIEFAEGKESEGRIDSWEVSFVLYYMSLTLKALGKTTRADDVFAKAKEFGYTG